MEKTETEPWKKTACIICSLNCGLEIKTEGSRITKIKGDKLHPISQGYICEKSQRMDFYQNGADRIDSPKRRRPDGSYEDIDWDTAISEIAEKFASIKRKYGARAFCTTEVAVRAIIWWYICRQHHQSLGDSVQVQRIGPGKNGRGLGAGQDDRCAGARRL